ncbi:uncharacterized protein [Triticum aestivum]|uniref:Uncharacterized protein n=1 Tax=Aegilops tauschii subsp. strangulata TaxID=200361 RepID=A0A453NTZ2_AEGTS|nr:uncharacterized protein LOC123144444 [Triticum aestivum]
MVGSLAALDRARAQSSCSGTRRSREALSHSVNLTIGSWVQPRPPSPERRGRVLLPREGHAAADETESPSEPANMTWLVSRDRLGYLQKCHQSEVLNQAIASRLIHMILQRQQKFFMYIPSYKRRARHAPPTNAFPGDPRPRARLSPTSRYRCSLSAGCGKVV